MKKIQPPRFLGFLLWLTLLFLYAPLVWLVLGSFQERNENEVVWTLKWYQMLFEDQTLWQSFSNSLTVGFWSSTISTLAGTVTGIYLAISNSWISRWIKSMTLISLILPEIVFALSLLCLFILVRWPLSLLTVILAHSIFSFSFVVLTVSSRWNQFNPIWIEAAHDLGASEWDIYRRIILPFLGTAMISGWFLSFLISFDDFLITFFVNGIGSDTWPVKLYTSMRMGLSPKLNALASLLLALSFIFVLLFVYFRHRKEEKYV